MSKSALEKSPSRILTIASSICATGSVIIFPIAVPIKVAITIAMTNIAIIITNIKINTIFTTFFACTS